jgi:NTE family protein
MKNDLDLNTSTESLEKVLVLQGGGSLGAFGCGVYKALAKSNIKLDILAGTSIGGVNAAIIAGSKNEEPEKALEEFWLEIGENSINLNTYFNTSSLFKEPYSSFSYLPIIENYSNLKSLLSFYSSSLYGNKAIFLPRWRSDLININQGFSNPTKWTYLYDNTPLAKTLDV